MRFITHISLSPHARVEFLPTMTPEDLQKAGIEEPAKQWG
jgi:hypothetical protein